MKIGQIPFPCPYHPLTGLFIDHRRRMGRGRGALAPPPPHFFADGIFLTCERPAFQTKSRKQMQTCSQYSIWFIQYLFICDRKCPLSPFVPSNVVLSCLVRMADIWARLAQKEDSLSALQLTGALWYSLSNTHTPPPIHPYPQPPPPPPPTPPPTPTFWTAPPPLLKGALF